MVYLPCCTRTIYGVIHMAQTKMQQCRNFWVDKPTALIFLQFLTGSVLGGALVCYVDRNLRISELVPVMVWHVDSFSLQPLLIHNIKLLLLLYLSAFLSCGPLLVPAVLGLDGFFTGSLIAHAAVTDAPAWLSVLIAVHLLLIVPYGFVLGHWSIRQALYERTTGDSIMRDKLELAAPTEEDKKIVADIENVKQIVSGVRTVRNQKNVAPKEKLLLQIVDSRVFEPYYDVVMKMANLEDIAIVSQKSATASNFMVGTVEFSIPLGSLINVEEEVKKLESQLEHLEGFLAGVVKKLSNERFVQNAPEAVVAMERKKQSDAEEKIATIKETLATLKLSK